MQVRPMRSRKRMRLHHDSWRSGGVRGRASEGRAVMTMTKRIVLSVCAFFLVLLIVWLAGMFFVE